MSSIHEAIYKDTRRNKGPMPNFVALTSHQERQGDTTNDDFHQRLQERRLEERQKRLAEGGRGGGYNDRQEISYNTGGKSSAEDDEKYDEFGRRKAKPGQLPGSKSARAQAALERLRQKSMGKAAGSAREAQEDPREGRPAAGRGASRSRECSRSRNNRSRSREDRSRSRQRGDRRGGR